jgi:hypothetical protein
MKKILLTLFSFLALTQLYAQNIEVSVLGNTGLFRYVGNYTTSTSFINGGTAGAKTGYTNNPDGNKDAASYGLTIQVQHVDKSGFIWGLQGGYQILRSKVDLTGVYRADVYYATGDYVAAPGSDPATGKTILQSQDILVGPYIGYRLKVNSVNIDLMPGIQLGINTNLHEYGKATDQQNNVFETDLDRGKFPADFRVGFGVAAGYNKFSLTAGFVQGLTNFSNHLLNDSPTAYYTHSQLISFGVAYRLK